MMPRLSVSNGLHIFVILEALSLTQSDMVAQTCLEFINDMSPVINLLEDGYIPNSIQPHNQNGSTTNSLIVTVTAQQQIQSEPCMCKCLIYIENIKNIEKI